MKTNIASMFACTILLALASCGKSSGGGNGTGTVPVIAAKESTPSLVFVTNTAPAPAPAPVVVEEVLPASVELEEVLTAPVELEEVLTAPVDVLILDENTVEIVVDNAAEAVVAQEIAQDLAAQVDLSGMRAELAQKIRQLEHKLEALLRVPSSAPGKLKEIERTRIELALCQKLYLQVER